jgi:tetratricopeptide (TPR) repeat protein
MLRPFIVCCLVSISAFKVHAQQEPSLLETWRECLVPPRFGLSFGLTIQERANQIAFGTNNDEDSQAFLSWIDERIKTNPVNMSLWLERYAYLPDKHVDIRKTCETAIQLVQEQLVKAPNNLELQIILIDLYVAIGNEMLSKQLADKLVETRPDYLPGVLIQNLLAHKQGKCQESLSKALQLTKDHPASPRVWEHLSAIYMQELLRALLSLLPRFDPSHEITADTKSMIDVLISLKNTCGAQRIIIQQHFSELQNTINKALDANAKARDCVGNDYVLKARMLGQQVAYSMIKMMLDDSSQYAQQSILQIMANLEEVRIEEMLQNQPAHVILQSIVLMYHSTRLAAAIQLSPTGREIAKINDPVERKRVIQVIYSKEYKTLSQFADQLKSKDIHGPMKALIDCQFGMNAILFEADYLTARKHFLSSLEQHPARTTSLIGLIGTYRLTRQPLRWNDLPSFVQKQYETARGHAIFAQNLLLYDKPDLPEATLNIERALKHDPQHVTALMLRASVQALKDQSEASLDEATKYWQAGYDAASKAGTVKEIEAEYYGVAAAIEVLRGNTRQAHTLLDLGLKQQGANETLKNAKRRLNNIQQVGG